MLPILLQYNHNLKGENYIKNKYNKNICLLNLQQGLSCQLLLNRKDKKRVSKTREKMANQKRALPKIRIDSFWLSWKRTGCFENSFKNI